MNRKSENTLIVKYLTETIKDNKRNPQYDGVYACTVDDKPRLVRTNGFTMAILDGFTVKNWTQGVYKKSSNFMLGETTDYVNYQVVLVPEDSPLRLPKYMREDLTLAEIIREICTTMECHDVKWLQNIQDFIVFVDNLPKKSDKRRFTLFPERNTVEILVQYSEDKTIRFLGVVN